MDASGEIIRDYYLSELPHQALVANISARLRSGPHAMLRVSGEAGAGKTWVAQHVGRSWIDDGGAMLVGEGDIAFSQRSLAALSFALGNSKKTPANALRKTSRASIGLAEKLLGAGGAATSIFDVLTSVVDQRFERATRALSATEREIVLDIRRLAKRTPLLIIADNAHWWDGASLCLLEFIRHEKIVSLLPELRRVSILLIDTHEQQGAADEQIFRRVVSAASVPSYSLRKVGRPAFGSALRAIGLSRPLPEETLDLLYHATGAHLKLCEQVVSVAEQSSGFDATILGSSDLLRRTLEQRLASFGKDAASLSELLHAAAPIGLRFGRAHLACVVKRPSGEVQRLLDLAESATLVVCSGSSATFTHDLLRTHFLLGGTATEIRERHAQLAQCVKILQPGEYETRARFLKTAGNEEEALDLHAVAIVRRARDAASLAQIEREIASKLADDPALGSLVRCIAETYGLIGCGQYKEALSACAAMADSRGGLIAAERAYAEALVWTEQQTLEGFRESRSILEQWRAGLLGETELWLRFGLLLQQTFILSDDLERARSVEHGLQAALGERAGFDPSALHLMQVQNRRSAGLYGSAVAELKINRAVAYFAAAAKDGQVGSLIELYKSLTNHCAVLLTLSRTGDALAAGRRAANVLIDNPEVSFPRKDVLAHNLAMTFLRSKEIGLDEAIVLQQQVVTSVEAGNDNFLQRCSLASMLLLQGRLSEAREMAEALNREILREGISESFLLYYASVLAEAIAVRAGNWDIARNLIGKTEVLVKSVNWTSAPYVRRRHELLRTMINEDPDALLSPEFDEVLIQRNPLQIGDEWAHYGRIVPLCELSFWVDS